VFNIGCGEAIDLNQVVALIGDILADGPMRSRPYEPERAGDIKHSWATSAQRAARSVTARRCRSPRAAPHDRLV
jgi:hypothetical protein